MRIRTLQLVEDSNQFQPAELDGVDAHPWTVAVKELKVAGITVVQRVDRIPKGAEVDLPTRQAEQLIALGLAEAV